MKYSSQFSAQALGLGSVEAPTILSSDEQLTLRQLIELLQSVAEKNPEALDMPVLHYDCLPTTTITVDPQEECVIIS